MSYEKSSPRYTRSQARAKSQTMDDRIEPRDSVSQVSKEHSHASVTSRTTTSSHGSGRSKEQLDLDINALAIRMSSQEKRA